MRFRVFRGSELSCPISDPRSLLRLDGDLYESTIQVLDGFYPKVSPGGFGIIDDYGAMPSCRAAVEDFRRDHRVNEPLMDIDGKGMLWRKRF